MQTEAELQAAGAAVGDGPEASPELQRLRRLRRGLVLALGVQLLVLAATGVYLWFRYRPSSAAAWAGLDGVGDRASTVGHVRDLHRWTSHLTVATACATGAIAMAEAFVARSPRRPTARAVLGPLLAVTVVVAAFSGTLLPWDQLALKAVTVGTDLAGYNPIFGDQVRFAIVGGAEVGVGTLRTWTVVHVVTALLAVALLVALGRGHRRNRSPSPTGPPGAPSS